MLRNLLRLTLFTYLFLQDNSDLKYRTVKKSGTVFQRDVASINGAVDVLVLSGFSHVNAEQLVLTRQDPGLLYVVASVLQSALAMARPNS